MTTQQKFNDWLDKIIKTEKPNDDIIAYWFGIVETTEGFETYLVGSKEFDEDDDDWACNTDFVPKNKYLPIGQRDGDEWEQTIEEIKGYITDYILSPNFKNSFLEKAKAIATGFDDGDVIRVR